MPNTLAVEDSASTLTYAQLWRHAGTLAGRLAAGGVHRGEFVVVDLPRSAALVVALLGILRAGAAYVALDDHAPAGRNDVIRRETGARATLHPGAEPGAVAVRWHGAPASGSDHPVSVAVAADDPAYVAYTSGSTGRPKGVVVPHRAVHRLVVDQPYCPLGPGDRVANSANPAFDATTFEIWAPLSAGATVVVLPTPTELRLDEWSALVDRQRITTMFLTTSLFHMIAWERPDAFRTVRDLIVGGEQLAIGAVRAVLAAGPPARLVNGYGPTETTTFATHFACTPASIAGLDRIPIGVALRRTSLRILAEDGRDVTADQVGELCVGGPGVATGYLDQPDLTAQRFVTDDRTGATMYRTGDLARWRAGGVVELVGRRDRQVKLRGFRIELDEIEDAAVGTGLVTAAFVERVGDGAAAALVGFARPVEGRDLDPAELTAALRRHLPDYMVPARWITVAAVPLGSTGKVDRAGLLALLDRAPAADAGPAPTTDPLTRQVQDIWREVLGRSAVGPADNFIEVGGNSILAVQVTSRLRQRLRVEVEPGDVLLAPSMADLAETLRAGGA